MSGVLWRYSLREGGEIEMPEGAEVLSVAEQKGEPVLWVRVNRTAELYEGRTFRLVGTGDVVPDQDARFIGTLAMHDGEVVQHVFELQSARRLVTAMTLCLFQFGADAVGGRMGTPDPYALGVASDGRCFMPIAPAPDINSFAKEGMTLDLSTRFVRSPNMEGSYPLGRLLEGGGPASPIEWAPGRLVDAGMGNWGYYVGRHEVLLSRRRAEA